MYSNLFNGIAEVNKQSSIKKEAKKGNGIQFESFSNENYYHKFNINCDW